ncbi:hypothetical protein BCR36DRAFT_325010 [Piromyces finnis]|uniref:RING-type domain-containing protein n=1 Tax=Piromyces finnis TaxID=1754191 RepID=A0A1Y1VDS3_9FUNG|nr:hypothetical protein BCR36DRAFT_325010 [Piromyces finnis]|eukprot:ORX52203.1 hypothetical protein BCR36DRAFT_325010 [Piromyces finnis]
MKPMNIDNELLHVEEKDIKNKEYYEGIKDLVNCSICLEIIRQPVQCDKCQHCFCAECVKGLTDCPYRCKNNKFSTSYICNNLLSRLIIECECGKEVNYDFIKKHKKECKTIYYKLEYLKLKNGYELFKKKLNEKNDNIWEYTILSNLHPHILTCKRTFLIAWYCDNCKNKFDENTPSYCCTLCDYDLCYNCTKGTVTKGTITNKIIEYYNIYKDGNRMDNCKIISQLHNHPVEYSKSLTERYCDNCKNKINTYSYRCFLCDFDLCSCCAQYTLSS